MTILVLSPRYTPDSNALRNAALGAGWHVERLTNYRPPEQLRGQRITLYGEALFTTIIADELEYALLETPSNWLTQLPAPYLKRQIVHTTLAEARLTASPAFIKPAEGKSFAAQVYASGADLPSSEVEADGFPVLVAEPVAWDIEFRCFVLNREVVTFSLYKRAGDASDDIAPAEPDEIGAMQAFCTEMLADNSITMPPAFVVDVGFITGRGPAVIEANPAWASGVYQCDAAKILPVLVRSCVPLADLTPADMPWQIQRFSDGEG